MWMSLVTLFFIVVLLYFSRHDIMHAWQLVMTINPWWLLAFIPLFLLSYLATGEMAFSYLRSKGAIDEISPLTQIRISLEVNFVNHALPSGGASGVSYMTWRLGKIGVSHGKAAMAQAVRLAVSYAAFSLLTVIAVLAITIDTGVNRWLILVSSMLVSSTIIILLLGVYFLHDIGRVRKAARWVKRLADRVIRMVTFGRRTQAFGEAQLETFLIDAHDDYKSLRHDKRHLLKPFLWAILFVIVEVAIFWLSFYTLGSPVNPAPIFKYPGAIKLDILVASGLFPSSYPAANCVRRLAPAEAYQLLEIFLP